jgi:hypothetical protein
VGRVPALRPITRPSRSCRFPTTAIGQARVLAIHDLAAEQPELLAVAPPQDLRHPGSPQSRARPRAHPSPIAVEMMRAKHGSLARGRAAHPADPGSSPVRAARGHAKGGPMDLGPSGRNAIVRASSRGLGRACARSPACEGAGSTARTRIAQRFQNLGAGRPGLEPGPPATDPSNHDQDAPVQTRSHHSDNRLIILTSVITTA